MQPTDAELRIILESVPGWRDAITAVDPLPGGITNRSVRVTTLSGSFVVRVPGEQTDLLGIDRRAEAAVTLVAARRGIGPNTMCEIPAFGTVICDFLEARTATAEDLRVPDTLRSVAELISNLHTCDAVPHDFPIFTIITQHAHDAAARGRSHSAVPEILNVVEKVHRTYRRSELTDTLCHNDLLPANVLIGPDDRVWLIDYEYAGMNAALFDLANLSVNAGLDDDADELLLTVAHGSATQEDHDRLDLMKVVSECREGLWALVQAAIHPDGPIDYYAYADARLTSAATLSRSAKTTAQLIRTARH